MLIFVKISLPLCFLIYDFFCCLAPLWTRPSWHYQSWPSQQHRRQSGGYPRYHKTSPLRIQNPPDPRCHRDCIKLINEILFMYFNGYFPQIYFRSIKITNDGGCLKHGGFVFLDKLIIPVSEEDWSLPRVSVTNNAEFLVDESPSGSGWTIRHAAWWRNVPIKTDTLLLIS